MRGLYATLFGGNVNTDGGFIVPEPFGRQLSLIARVYAGGNTFRGRNRVIHRHRFRKQRAASIPVAIREVLGNVYLYRPCVTLPTAVG